MVRRSKEIKIKCIICKEVKIILMSTMARCKPKTCGNILCLDKLKSIRDKIKYNKAKELRND